VNTAYPIIFLMLAWTPAGTSPALAATSPLVTVVTEGDF
jgi:hypothetical protein